RPRILACSVLPAPYRGRAEHDVEVARQCSNLAPPLQWAVREHRSIRRRTKSAMVPHVCEQTGPQPIPRLTEAMLDEAQCRYEGGETLRRIAVDLGVSR